MRVAASIRASNVNVLVASIDDNTAGFAIMRYGDDDAHLDLLAVAPPHRRAGIGRRLLEWLEKCAIVAGIFRVELEVRAGNEAAQLFYKRLGYRPLASIPGYYQGMEAALRMGRDLSCGRSDEKTPGDTIRSDAPASLHPLWFQSFHTVQTFKLPKSNIQRFRG